jgi:hypothetical protein
MKVLLSISLAPAPLIEVGMRAMSLHEAEEEFHQACLCMKELLKQSSLSLLIGALQISVMCWNLWCAYYLSAYIQLNASRWSTGESVWTHGLLFSLIVIAAWLVYSAWRLNRRYVWAILVHALYLYLMRSIVMHMRQGVTGRP